MTASAARDMLDLLMDHQVHVKKNYLLHYYVNDTYRKAHWWLGGVLTVSSAAATACAAVFFSQGSPSIVPAIFSVLTFVLAALMTFLNFTNQASSHKQAASNYYCLSLKCRSFLADPELATFSPEQYRRFETDLVEQIGRLEKDSPAIPAWAYRKALRIIKQYDQTSDAVGNIERKKTANQLLHGAAGSRVDASPIGP